jgi:hypothetical protein
MAKTNKGAISDITFAIISTEMSEISFATRGRVPSYCKMFCTDISPCVAQKGGNSHLGQWFPTCGTRTWVYAADLLGGTRE